jgi:hypothetical protein
VKRRSIERVPGDNGWPFSKNPVVTYGELPPREDEDIADWDSIHTHEERLAAIQNDYNAHLEGVKSVRAEAMAARQSIQNTMATLATRASQLDHLIEMTEGALSEQRSGPGWTGLPDPNGG